MRRTFGGSLALAGFGLLALGLVYAGAQASQGKDGDATALRAQLEKVQQRLQLLEDRNAIENLQGAYGYYLDKALYDDIVDLFTDDVSLEYSGRGVYVGKDRARKLMQIMPGGKTGLQEGMLQNHMQLQGVINVAPDGRTAKARWRAFMMTGQYGKSATWHEGPYEMEYRKENGVWKIRKLHWYVTFQAPYEEGWAKASVPFPTVREDFPPDLPPTEVYRQLPGVYIPPFSFNNPVTGKPTRSGHVKPPDAR